MKRRWTLFAVTMLLLLLSFGNTFIIAEEREEQMKKGFDEMKSSISTRSIMIFPMIMMNRPFKNVSQVAALMFEKTGLMKIEVADNDFVPEAGKDIWSISDAFGEFIRTHPIVTDYAIYGEFVGDPESGVKEVRSVIVDQKGNCVWADQQTPEDPDFQKVKPDCPMLCTVLLVDRIRTALALPSFDREDAPEGKWAAFLRKDSGLPSDEELKAIEVRRKAMEGSFSGSRVMVFPVLVNDNASKENAVHLAELMNGKKSCVAQLSDQSVAFEIGRASNEQKMLWELAEKFRDYVQKNAINADYALYAQYFIDTEGKHVGAVHFILTNAKGEYIIVDFQNDHWPDFQSIDPKTAHDCDELVVKRLEGYF